MIIRSLLLSSAARRVTTPNLGLLGVESLPGTGCVLRLPRAAAGRGKWLMRTLLRKTEFSGVLHEVNIETIATGQELGII